MILEKQYTLEMRTTFSLCAPHLGESLCRLWGGGVCLNDKKEKYSKVDGDTTELNSREAGEQWEETFLPILKFAQLKGAKG